MNTKNKTSGRSNLFRAFAITLLLATFGHVSPAEANDRDGVNGGNVSSFTVGESDGRPAYIFSQVGPSKWNRQPVGRSGPGVDLVEVKREEWSLTLRNKSGGLVRIDTWTGIVYLTPPGGAESSSGKALSQYAHSRLDRVTR